MGDLKVELEIKHCLLCGRPLNSKQIRDDTIPHYCEYYIRQLNLFGYKAIDRLDTSLMIQQKDGDV